MGDNQHEYYNDGVYNTPQYRIDALNRDGRLPPATIPYESEYIYAPTNSPHLPVSHNSKIETQQSRPKQQVVQDDYDEENDGYNIASNLPKTTADRSVQKESGGEKISESSNKKKSRCCTCKTCTIICLIVVILALCACGGLIALMIDYEKRERLFNDKGILF